MQASHVSRRSVLKQTGALLSGLALSRLATGATTAPGSSPASAAGTIVIEALAPFFRASISALVKPTRETQPIGAQKVKG